jgi:hypothetical protein
LEQVNEKRNALMAVMFGSAMMRAPVAEVNREGLGGSGRDPLAAAEHDWYTAGVHAEVAERQTRTA